MKKTLVALAVVAAGSANAAEVYSLDGVSVNISGEVELQYVKTQSKTQDPELTVAEGSFGFDMDYEMTEDFAMAAHLDMDANNETDNVTRGDVYMSFVVEQAHTLSLGKQPTILDDAGVGDDYEFGFTSYVTSLTSSGDQVIKYKYDGGETFYGGVAYSAYANEATTSSVSDDDYEADGRIGARVNDYDFTLYVAKGEHVDLEETAVAVEARYVLGDLSFAGTVATSSAEQASASDRDKDLVGLSALYWDGGRIEYGIGWSVIDDSTLADKVNDVYVNATYTFTDEVNAFVEIGLTDEDNTDTGFVVGINASF